MVQYSESLPLAVFWGMYKLSAYFLRFFVATENIPLKSTGSPLSGCILPHSIRGEQAAGRRQKGVKNMGFKEVMVGVVTGTIAFVVMWIFLYTICVHFGLLTPIF